MNAAAFFARDFLGIGSDFKICLMGQLMGSLSSQVNKPSSVTLSFVMGTNFVKESLGNFKQYLLMIEIAELRVTTAPETVLYVYFVANCSSKDASKGTDVSSSFMSLGPPEPTKFSFKICSMA